MNSQNTIRILLVDDHELILDGLKSLIKVEKGLEIVSTATNGIEALDRLRETQIDVVILDIDMPIMNGLEAAKRIREHYQQVKVLILTMHNDIKYIKAIIATGAHGYILKNRGKEELVTAIKVIISGEEYFGEAVTRSIINDMKDDEKKKEVRLTKREIDVLKLIADGKTTPQISKMLFIAPSTVETHRRNLLDKTGVINSKGLVKYAIEKGYT
ncbi:response regulator transcription factor [Dokdonia sp.]|uniref:response regulator transcription factor n=1 Tax=Dokdonia sp. TaxID=2024995 RepID=UPI003266EECD